MNLTRKLFPLVLLSLVPAAHAVDPPLVKEGLWSVTTQTTTADGATTTQTSTICRSHDYDAYMYDKEKKSGCTIERSQSGNAFSERATCSAVGSVIDSRSTTTKISDTEYHTEAHSTMTPPLHGIAETGRVMDHKYLGSCPAGQQPGDLTQPDGRVIHGWRH